MLPRSPGQASSTYRSVRLFVRNFTGGYFAKIVVTFRYPSAVAMT
jgi:hypothetical protein